MGDSRIQPTFLTRKLINNYRFGRKQFVIDILHHGMLNLSMTEIQHKLKRIYGVKDLQFFSMVSIHRVHAIQDSASYMTLWHLPKNMSLTIDLLRMEFKPILEKQKENANKEQRK